jgi:hypothetical protein
MRALQKRMRSTRPIVLCVLVLKGSLELGDSEVQILSGREDESVASSDGSHDLLYRESAISSQYTPSPLPSLELSIRTIKEKWERRA